MTTIEERLSKVNNLVEVLTLSRKMKAEGLDEMEVNAAVTKRRRELAAANQRVSTIERVILPVLNKQVSPMTMFAIEYAEEKRNCSIKVAGPKFII